MSGPPGSFPPGGFPGGPGFPSGPGGFGGPGFPGPGMGPNFMGGGMGGAMGGGMGGLGPMGMGMGMGMVPPGMGMTPMGQMGGMGFPPGPGGMMRPPGMGMGMGMGMGNNNNNNNNNVPQRGGMLISQMKAAQGPGPGVAAVAAPAAVRAEKSTTVYVGKIASSLEDSVVKQLLDACGKVVSWKRATDPETTEMKGFGFVEFEDAEGCLRAIRLLNGLKIDNQELLLKGNSATQRYLEDYEGQKSVQRKKDADERAAKAKAKEEEGEVAGDGGDDAKDSDQEEDNRVLETIMAIATDREEIAQKKAAAASVLNMVGGPDEQLPPPPRLPSGSSSASKRGRESERDRDRERDRDGGGGEISREAWERERERRREEEREREEEEKARRAMERLYESKLREWEHVESSRMKEREREEKRVKELESERRRQCRAELEKSDSDDDLEPWQRRPIRSSRRALERRKRKGMEVADDDVDRRRHEEEMEMEAPRRAPAVEEDVAGSGGAMDTGEGAPVEKPYSPEPEVDPNDPIYKAMVEAARAPPKHRPAAPPAVQQPTAQQHAAQHAHHPSADRADLNGSIRAGHREFLSDTPSAAAAHPASLAVAPQAAPPPVASSALSSMRPGGSKGKAGALAALFGDEEDDSKKRTLKPIKYTQEEMMAVQAVKPAEQPTQPPAAATAAAAAIAPASSDPKVQLRRLMDSIPTKKDDVWVYNIRWDAYNPSTMLEKFRVWVTQKVEGLLGMPEPTLVGYIMTLIQSRSAPAKLAAELAPVLDSETETFVIKLYRMVIYETEKAAAGF